MNFENQATQIKGCILQVHPDMTHADAWHMAQAIASGRDLAPDTTETREDDVEVYMQGGALIIF